MIIIDLIFINALIFYRSTLNNGTNNLEPVLYWTELSMNWEYNFYYLNLAKLIVWGILPTILLIYFNSLVYLGMKSSNIALEKEHKIRRFNQEKNLSSVMIGIVLVFIICQTPRTLTYCCCFVFLNGWIECTNNTDINNMSLIMSTPKWFMLTWIVSDFLLVLNTSVNTVIYCCINSKFRRQIALSVRKIANESFNPNSRNKI